MNQIELLPPKANIETKVILKKVALAHRYLAELKGVARSIPNQNILIDTLALQDVNRQHKVD